MTKKIILSSLLSATLLVSTATASENKETNIKTKVEKKQAQAVKVTRDNYQYAEAIRNAQNYIKLGADNKWAHFRDISPIGPKAPTIRMNMDTLYSVAVLDNATQNIELTIPEGDVLRTILVLDDQGYSKHYFQKVGKHKIVSDSPFVILIARIGVKDYSRDADIQYARKIQDEFKITGQGTKPFSPTKYDQDSLHALTAELNKEFLAGSGILVYGQQKDDVDEKQRLLSNAAGWGGMHDQINTYNSSANMSGDVCRQVHFDDPKVGDFFSFTLYDSDGYLMDGKTSINSYNMKKNDDKSYTVSFNCGSDATNNITSTGRDFNYIVRTYNASDVVKSGKWNPIKPTVVKK